jgi:Tol biopolymer transport system component/DNA-binding winged helix-turn-helix (wHTH) protein
LKIKLHAQPFAVLAMLLERPGETVSREEIQQKLWGSETFVDFDHGLNKAVNKLREALGDNADNPRYIETLPRRGYRFVGGVEQSPPSQTAIRGEENNETRSSKARIRTWWLVGAGILGLFGALGVGLHRNRSSVQVPKVLMYRQLTSGHGAKGENACALDGRLVTDGTRVFFAETDSPVSEVSVSGGEAIKFAASFTCFAVSDISPDKTELLGYSPSNNGPSEQQLWSLSVVNGQLRRIGNLNGNAATWSPDGLRIVYAHENNLSRATDIYVASRDGSDQRKLVGFEKTHVDSIRWSPDGKVLRIVTHRPSVLWELFPDGTNLHRVPMLEGDAYRIVEQSWTADGRYSILTVRRQGIGGGSDIWVARESPSHIPAKPVQLTTGPMRFWQPVASPDGKHIYVVAGQTRGELLRYDLRTRQLRPFLSGISAENLDFSRDGKSVTYVTFPEGVLWRSKVDGSDRLQLTMAPLHAAVPRWSPDGKRIAFATWTPGGYSKIYMVNAEGGNPEVVAEDQRDFLDPTWTPDGNALILGGWSGSKISGLDLRTRRVSDIPGSAGLYSPRVSPDGQYIVAMDTPHVTKMTLFDQHTQKWTDLLAAGTLNPGWPQWSSDGQFVYFRGTAPGKQGPSLYRVNITNHKLERLADIEIPEGVAGFFGPWLGVTPDGSPLVLRDRSIQEIYALDVDLP